MQLRLLHILCGDEEVAKKVNKSIDGNESVIERWERKNKDSLSLYLTVSDQDQALFDRLQEIAESEKTIRLMVHPIEALFPKDHETEEKEEEENNPGFFELISREEMLEILRQEAGLNGSYLSLVILSSIVATIALIQGNSALLIGAMVLTPLLGPNLALAFSAAAAETALTKRSTLAGGVGIGIAFCVSLLTGFAFARPAEQAMADMLLGYGFESILIALCAGLAASVVLLKGSASSLIGVMVAVAFLPPLALAGLSLSVNNIGQFNEALLLFAINLAAFNLAVKAALLLAGVRPKRGEQEEGPFRQIIIYIIGWVITIGVLSAGLYLSL